MNYKKGDTIHVFRDTRDGRVIQKAEVIDTCERPQALKIYYVWGIKSQHHVRMWIAASEVVR